MAASEFVVWRDGAHVATVEAVGMLSALVRVGQLHPDLDANASDRWTVERVPGCERCSNGLQYDPRVDGCVIDCPHCNGGPRDA